MKQKYILGIYDKLINEIKNYRTTTEAEILGYLKKCVQESLHLHQVCFTKQDDIITYSFQNKVHNLHPLAASFTGSRTTADPVLDQMTPQILKELSIQEDVAVCYWILENNNYSLIIQEPCKIEDLPAEERFFLYCFQLVKNENFKILLQLKEKVYGLSTREKMEHYIHRKQNALENLTVDLIKDINPQSSKDIYNLSLDYGLVDCLKITFIHLEKLQIFIEKEYGNFLDENKRVPYRTLLVKEFEIIETLHYVQSRLLEINVSEGLRTMAFVPLLKMATTNIQEKLTYREFYYSTAYIKELSRKLEHRKQVEEADLEEWLFDLNYNSLDFFDFGKDRIIRNVETLESDIKKIGLLYQLLKYYNQKNSVTTAKFNPNRPCIKEQVIHWIDEEIEYLTRKKTLESNVGVVPPIKIKTSFSVPQLSFFFFVLVKCGILLPKTHSDIFRLVSNNFKTDHTDAISYNSVKNYFNSADLGAMEFVRTKLFSLLNFIKI